MLKNLVTGCFKPLVPPLLNAGSFNVQQLRTTFVLKRRYPVPLHKKNEKPIKLKSRHFVYDLVEFKNTTKQQNIDVILTTFVDGIGRKGDIVNVKPMRAYNDLLLPGLATYVTPENIEKYTKDVDDTDEENYSSSYAKKTLNYLEKRVFAIVMNKNHPWEIEPWHIRVSLRKAGVYILKESSIELPKFKITGPDLTKQNKEFKVIVTINNKEKAVVRCRIHHWTTDPFDRIPHIVDHWLLDAEPLLGPETPETTDTAAAK